LEKKKEYSAENKSYKFFENKGPVTPESLREKREYIDELNKEKEKSASIRELKKKDVREFVEVTLGFNLTPISSMGFPSGKTNEEIITNLKKFNTEENFFVLADRNDRFAGFCGIEHHEEIYGNKLFFIHGPLVNFKFQKNCYGDELLNKTLEFAALKGLEMAVTSINSKNIVGERLLLKNGFEKFKTGLILEEKKATKVRIFKNFDDKIFVVENSENSEELYELFKKDYLNSLISETGFKKIIKKKERLFFICMRGEELAGYMELEVTNSKIPIIVSFGIHKENGDQDSFRLLLFSIIQFVFKKRGIVSLKIMIDNKDQFMEEVNKLDFRFVEQMNWYKKTL
jgi:RimJ/RimL family protein N-acetyltransferase